MERRITFARVLTQFQGKLSLALEVQKRGLDMYLSKVPDYKIIQSFMEVESGKDDTSRSMLQ